MLIFLYTTNPRKCGDSPYLFSLVVDLTWYYATLIGRHASIKYIINIHSKAPLQVVTHKKNCNIKNYYFSDSFITYASNLVNTSNRKATDRLPKINIINSYFYLYLQSACKIIIDLFTRKV